MSHRFFKIVVKSFPTHEVRAMGQKLEGSCGFSAAEALGIRWITPCFHPHGMVLSCQQRLKRSSRVGVRDGQHLNIYHIWDLVEWARGGL